MTALFSSRRAALVLLVLAAPQAPAATPGRAAWAAEAPASCEHCGMDRTRFARSRMLVTRADGRTVGTCSVNCLAAELAGNQILGTDFLAVADHARPRQLVDARTAFWVVGGREQGVMTEVPKWAFGKRQDAMRFIRRQGGRLAAFDAVLALAAGELGN